MLKDWLIKLSKLRVDRASKNPAPHKPLLLLAIIDHIERGLIDSKIVRLTPELAFRFLGYWEIVSERRCSVGRVELPFFYLRSDGFLNHIAFNGLESALDSIRPTSIELLNRVISYAELPEEFFHLMQVKSNRDEARITLISGNWFMPEEKIKLCEIVGLEPINVNSVREKIYQFEISDDLNEQIKKKGRDIKFRLQIVPLYRYSCALCSLRML